MRYAAPAEARPTWAVDIFNARKKTGESQTEFGERFGVGKQAVSQWESGQCEPPARVFSWLDWEDSPEGRDEMWEYIDWTKKEAPRVWDETGRPYPVLVPDEQLPAELRHVCDETCVWVKLPDDHVCWDWCTHPGNTNGL